MCAFAFSISSSSSAAVTIAEQPASRHAQRFIAASARLHAGDEVDRRIEDLLDKRLVGGDAELPAAVAVMTNLLPLVLVEVEPGHVALVLEHPDRVRPVLVDDLVHERLVFGVLADQDPAGFGSERDVTPLVREDAAEPLS